MLKTGIIGGGQLGRMLLQAAANYVVETYVLEDDEDCPAAHLCKHFVKGDIKNYQAVYDFGKNLDVITIEIEHVNIAALEQLEREGKFVIPKPSVLKTIGNKILQKEYYKAHQIPTADFSIIQTNADLMNVQFPFVQKVAEGGYDGRGVQIIRNETEMENIFTAPSVIETVVKLEKEIAMMVAVSQNGETALYPPVEMIFDQQLNQLDFQLCPAQLDEKILWKVEAIALSTVKHFNSPGLFAVEMFVTPDGDVLVNETAPRVHNSGHHTIEAHYCSQFDMLWRIILGLPLGNTDPILPSVMINIVGAPNHTGIAYYKGLEEVMKIENAFFHLYGKQFTKPGRKMGHATVLSAKKADLLHEANKIKHNLTVIVKE